MKKTMLVLTLFLSLPFSLKSSDFPVEAALALYAARANAPEDLGELNERETTPQSKNTKVSFLDCPFCQKHFNQSNCLNSHIMGKNHAKVSYPCPDCVMSYARPFKDYKKHLSNHGKELKKVSYTCNVCHQKPFSTPSFTTIARHLHENHTNSQISEMCSAQGAAVTVHATFSNEQDESCSAAAPQQEETPLTNPQTTLSFAAQHSQPAPLPAAASGPVVLMPVPPPFYFSPYPHFSFQPGGAPLQPSLPTPPVSLMYAHSSGQVFLFPPQQMMDMAYRTPFGQPY